MKNTEQKLKKLFDFQKFEKNKRLAEMIGEAASGGRELSDDDLSLVNAAGCSPLEKQVDFGPKKSEEAERAYK